MRKVNYDSNPWFKFTPLEEERLQLQAAHPERYPHVYLGEIDIGNKDLVFNYMMLLAAKENETPAHTESDKLVAGLDIANEGSDKTALCIKRGGHVLHIQTFDLQSNEAVRQAFDIAQQFNVTQLYYDSGGMVSGLLDEITKLKSPSFAVEGVHFGGKVLYQNRIYHERRKNKEMFVNWTAQIAWLIRDRFTNTLHGKPEQMSFAPEVAKNKDYMLQLEQPIAEYDGTNRVKINKHGEDKNSPSPDMFDATLLAFTGDLKQPMTVMSG